MQSTHQTRRLAITLNAKSHATESVRGALELLYVAMNEKAKQRGLLSYEVFADQGIENQFWVLEEWKSAEAFEQFLKEPIPELTEFLSTVGGWLEGNPAISVLESLS